MTDHVRKWYLVSSLLGKMKHTAWVTSTEWAEIAKEVVKKYNSAVTPTNKNFTQMQLNSNLLVRNAGTEDQEVVNEMNRIELGDDAKVFAFRRDNWKTASGSPFYDKVYGENEIGQTNAVVGEGRTRKNQDPVPNV